MSTSNATRQPSPATWRPSRRPGSQPRGRGGGGVPAPPSDAIQEGTGETPAPPDCATAEAALLCDIGHCIHVVDL